MCRSDPTSRDITFVAMPQGYVARFTSALINHHAGCLQRVMGCSEAMAKEITLRQLSSLYNNHNPQADSYLIAVQRLEQIIGGAWYSAQMGQAGILHWIMIEDIYQGNGHGKRLMQYVIQHCRSVGAIGLALHVFAENEQSVLLYRKLGFAMIGKEMYLQW